MIASGEQVMVRRQMQNGTLVRIGNVISVNEADGTARVSFPVDKTYATLPIDKLEPTSKRFNGMARVEVNPVRRRG